MPPPGAAPAPCGARGYLSSAQGSSSLFWLGCVRRGCPALPWDVRPAAAPPALLRAGTRRSGKLQLPKVRGALLLGQSPMLGTCGCVGWALGPSIFGGVEVFAAIIPNSAQLQAAQIPSG